MQIEEQKALTDAELAKRNCLKREKPYVFEKIMKYDEKVARGEKFDLT